MNGTQGCGRRLGRSRRTVLPAAVLAPVLLAAACGGPPGAEPGVSPPPGGAQQLVAFAQCLRSHGEPNAYISKPNSNSNSATPALTIMGYTLTGVTPGSAQFASAMKACKQLLPGGGPHPLTEGQKAQLLKFAACMRAHGYPGYPDPQFPSGGGVMEQPLPASIDTASPQFETALKTCNAAS